MIPSSVTDEEVALLGLLCEEPMHAWQIHKAVADRDMRFWTDLSQSTIYRQLRSLQSRGLVESREDVVTGRTRRVYSVTGAGRSAMRAALRTLLSEPQHVKWRVDLGTYNIRVLASSRRVACLEAYRSKLLQTIQWYRELDGYMEGDGCPLHHRAVARRPVYLMEGEIRWVDDFLEELRHGESDAAAKTRSPS